MKIKKYILIIYNNSCIYAHFKDSETVIQKD